MIVGDAHHRWFEEHRDRTDAAQRGPMRSAGRDPHCLMWRQQQVGVGRLDFGDAFECVFDLMQIVHVPEGDEVFALVEVCARTHGGVAPHLDVLGRGRAKRILGRTRRDGHEPNCKSRPMSTQEHDDVVRRSFARQTDLFVGEDSPFLVRRAEDLEWLGPLTPDLLVLDVACGAAHLAEEIAPLVRQVVGVDLTDELLELGAARLQDAQVRNVLLQSANAHALPFVDGSFDLVCCRAALHHIAEPATAVAEMVRVCRRGGTIALSDLVAPSVETRQAFDQLHQLIDPSHNRAMLAEELVALVPGEGVDFATSAGNVGRLPVDIAITEQSAHAAALATLQAEVDGGPRTGFEPAAQDGSFVVSFPTYRVRGVRRSDS